MDLEELRRISGDAKISAFRLETLPQYLVSQEEEDFAAWQAGTPEYLARNGLTRETLRMTG